MHKFILVGYLLIRYYIVQAQIPKLYQVQVNADGSISPRYLVINYLDTVQWILSNKTQSIIPITISDTSNLSCTSFKPISTVTNNDFTGPATSVLPGRQKQLVRFWTRRQLVSP